MSRERERIDAEGGNVDRDMADRLHGVGVKGHAARMGDGRERRHVLNRADLVVGEHDRDKGGGRRVDAASAIFGIGGSELLLEVIGAHMAFPVDGQVGHGDALALQGLGRMQDGVMLDSTGNEAHGRVCAKAVPKPCDGAAQDPGIRLGPATREVELVCRRAQAACRAGARVVESERSIAGHAMDAAGVAKHAGQIWHHRLERARRERRGGRIVGIQVGRCVFHKGPFAVRFSRCGTALRWRALR